MTKCRLNVASLVIVPFFVGACSCVPASTFADEFRDAGEVQVTVEEVLSDAEYRHLNREKPQPLDDSQLPEWAKRFLRWLFGTDAREANVGAPMLNFGDLLFYIVLGVLVILLLVLLIGLWKRTEVAAADQLPPASEEEAIAPSTPPGDIPTNEYEIRALSAAERGDFRSALRELVLGSMSWTERAGLVRYRRGLSNRDYIRAVWRRLPQRESLQQIVVEFERVFYGRRAASATTFESCLQEFRESFAREEAHAPVAG